MAGIFTRGEFRSQCFCFISTLLYDKLIYAIFMKVKEASLVRNMKLFFKKWFIVFEKIDQSGFFSNALV